MPPESAEIAVIVIAMAAAAVHYHICKKSGTWFFLFGFLGACVIAVSAIALLSAKAWPQAQAVMDICILLAGCAAFASSAWLLFAFRIAGEPYDP